MSLEKGASRIGAFNGGGLAKAEVALYRAGQNGASREEITALVIKVVDGQGSEPSFGHVDMSERAPFTGENLTQSM